jgi:hypothetical protein
MDVPVKLTQHNEAQLNELKAIVEGLVRDLDDPQTKHKDCLVNMAVRPFLCLVPDVTPDATAANKLRRVHEVLDAMISKTSMLAPIQVGTK